MSDQIKSTKFDVVSSSNSGDDIDLSLLGFNVINKEQREYLIVYYAIRSLLEKDAYVAHQKKCQQVIDGMLKGTITVPDFDPYTKFDKDAFRAGYTKLFGKDDQFFGDAAKMQANLKKLLSIAQKNYGMNLEQLKTWKQQDKERVQRILAAKRAALGLL